MKLHLPKTLRTALAAIAAAALPVATTVATGVFVLAGSSQQAQATAVITTTTTTNLDDNITYSGPIYTWDASKSNQGTFHSATFNLYSPNEDGTAMVTGSDISGTANNTPPGSDTANTPFWHIFVGPGGNGVDSYGYGATLRLAGATGAVSTNATFGPITVGGLISVADTDSAAYTFGRTNNNTDMKFKGREDTGVNMNIGATTTLNANTYTIQSSGTWNVDKTLTFTHRSGANSGGLATIETGNTVTTTGTGAVVFTDGLTMAGTAAIVNGAQMTINGTLTMEEGASIANTGTMSIAALSASGSTIANSGTLTISGALTLDGAGISLTNTAGTLNISGPLTTTLAFVQTGDSTIQYTDGSNGFRSGSASKVLITGEGALNVTANTISIDGTAYDLTKDEHSVSVTVALPNDDDRYYIADGNVAYGDAGNGAASSRTTGIVLAGGDLTMKQGLTDTAKTTGIQVTRSGATITLDGSAATLDAADLHIDTGVTGTKIAGNGTYEAGTALGNVTLDSSWTGTVVSTGTGQYVNNINLSSMLNDNSKLELRNWKGHGANNNGAFGGGELVFGEGNALTIGNAYSDRIYSLRKLSGTGNLVRTGDNSGAYFRLKVTEDASGWTGNISNAGGLTLIIGGTDNDVSLGASITQTGGTLDLRTEGGGVKTFAGSITKTGGTMNLELSGTAQAAFGSELTFNNIFAKGGKFANETLTTGVLKLMSGTLALDGTSLTVTGQHDWRGTDAENFSGNATLANGSTLELQRDGWMRQNTLTVDKTSTVKQAGFSITASGDTAATISMTDAGGARTIPGSDGVAISNATVTYSGTEAGTLSAALTDSHVVTTAEAGTLTINSAAVKTLTANSDVRVGADMSVSEGMGISLATGKVITLAAGVTLTHDGLAYTAGGADGSIAKVGDSTTDRWSSNTDIISAYYSTNTTVSDVTLTRKATGADKAINYQLINVNLVNEANNTNLNHEGNTLSGLTVTAGTVNVNQNATVGSEETAADITLGAAATVTVAAGKTLTNYTTVGADNTAATVTITNLDGGVATVKNEGADTAKASVETEGMVFTNANIGIATAGEVVSAATLSSSKLTVTGGGSVAADVKDNSVNSFDAGDGNVTIKSDDVKIADVTVGSGNTVKVGTSGTGTATVSGTATVAQGGTVDGSITLTSAGTLAITAATGSAPITINGNLTFGESAGQSASLDLTSLNITSAGTYALANVTGAVTGSVNLTGVTLAENLAWALKAGTEILATSANYPAASTSGAFVLSGAGSTPISLDVVELSGSTTPTTLTATAVSGTLVTGTVADPGTLTLKLDKNAADLAAATTLNISFQDDTVWSTITAGKDMGGYVTIALVGADGTDPVTLQPGAIVGFYGYEGVPGQPGTYFVGYIPEPATATLSLLALAALAARRRRK